LLEAPFQRGDAENAEMTRRRSAPQREELFSALAPRSPRLRVEA
jgi:hypothetical protein